MQQAKIKNYFNSVRQGAQSSTVRPNTGAGLQGKK